MRITNKSELFKEAWKMYRGNKITFSEALKYAWNIYKTYKDTGKRGDDNG